MAHLHALQRSAASLGAGLRPLHASDGISMSCRACQSVLQSLRRLVVEAALPPLPQPSPSCRLLHIAAASSRRSRGETVGTTTPEAPKQWQQQWQEHAVPAATDGGAAVDPLAAAAALCSITTALGQVIAAQANFVRVKVNVLEGGAPGEAPPQPRLLCVVRALLKKMRREVLVGDRVRLVGIDWVDGRGMVEEVLPRSSQLSEPAVANVDHVLLVFSAALPAFQPSPATRYLLSAEAAWLPVTVAINKADLPTPKEVQAVVDQVTSWGYRAVAVSVVSGEGLEQLMEALQRRVTVVAGPSGAGKSSIINALRMRSRGLESTLGAMAAEPSGTPAESSKEEEGARAEYSGSMQQQSQGAAEEQWRRQDVTQPPPVNEQQQQQQDVGRACSSLRMPADLELQAVGQVSQRIGRGKHTTRNVTLLELEDGSSGSGSGSGSSSGLVVDTPGFNQPDLAGMPATELWQHFPEIRQLLEEDRCTFRGCQHLQEPGCVVREAGWERYPLYCEIHAELKALEEQAATRQTGKKRREGSVRMKSRVGGQQGEEARLETKSHRRISRRSVRQKLSDLVKDVQEDEQF